MSMSKTLFPLLSTSSTQEEPPRHDRALTRILKTEVHNSHLAKSRSPTGKSGSPTQKNGVPPIRAVPYIFPIFAGSDTFE